MMGEAITRFMDSDEQQYVDAATSMLAWRFCWFFGIAACCAATMLFGGVAPLGFLAASLGYGAGYFVVMLLAWRYRSFWLNVTSTMLCVWGTHSVADRFGIHQQALFWQGFSLWLAFAALLVALLAPFIRRFCRLLPPTT